MLTVIEGKGFLKCCICKCTYDLLCANVSDARFDNTMTREHKNAWKCDACRCKEPKGSNANTPVRNSNFPDQQSNQVISTAPQSTIDGSYPKISEADEQNITMRRPGRDVRLMEIADDVNGIAIDDTFDTENIRSIVRQEMQRVVEERLPSIISDIISNVIEHRLTNVISNKIEELVLRKFNSAMERLNETCAKVEGKIMDIEKGEKRTLTTEGSPKKTGDSTRKSTRDTSNNSKTKASQVKASSSAKRSTNDRTLVVQTASENTQLTTENLTAQQNKPHFSLTQPAQKPALERATNNQRATTTATRDNDDVNTVANIEEDIQKNIVAEEWTEVRRRRSRAPSSVEILRGVAIAGATSLEAAEKTDYLHLFYVKEGTTDVQDARQKASVHPAFANAGRQAGVEAWRIENFNPVPVAQKDYGQFYKGDSYIVLKTTADKRNNLSWDIYYWIGSESSQDEYGAAAIYTVGLDDKFNGAAVQHRETLGYESQQFKDLFRPAIRYLDGGVASGFHHVTTNPGAEKRLFQVKGKRNVRVRQVDPIISSMNKGDCFIMDVGNDVYVYVGEKARNVEKLKATSIANQIRDQDHNGRARVETIDVYSSEADYDKFFNALGSGSKNLVPEDSAGGDDQTFERNEEQSVILNEVSDSSGKVKVSPLPKPYKQEQLKPQEAYILDTISGSIYVWLGRQATDREKSEAMSKAQQYKSAKNYPAWVQVIGIPQGTEPAIFKQYFTTWRDVGMSHSRLVRSVEVKTSTESLMTREVPQSDAEYHLYKIDLKSDNTVGLQEIPHFKQSDLDRDEVYVLELRDEFFVWVGENTLDRIRKSSETIISAFRALRNHTGLSTVVKQHLEPIRFTVAFGVYEPNGMKWNDSNGDQSKEDALNTNDI